MMKAIIAAIIALVLSGCIVGEIPCPRDSGSEIDGCN